MKLELSNTECLLCLCAGKGWPSLQVREWQEIFLFHQPLYQADWRNDLSLTTYYGSSQCTSMCTETFSDLN